MPQAWRSSEEDVLTYALFPEIAKDYFLWRDGRQESQQAIGNRQQIGKVGRVALCWRWLAQMILFSGYSMIPTAPF